MQSSATTFAAVALFTFARASPFLYPRNATQNVTTSLHSNATQNVTTSLQSAGTLKGNFSSVKCSDDAVGDPRGTPELRWNEADADDAWIAVARFWNEDPASQGLPFVQVVSNFWHGPEQWNCGKLGSDPCGAGPGSCGDSTERGDVDTPAGWLILQSFTTLHNFQYNQYQAIGDAESSVQGEIGTFSSTFSPIEDKESAIKVLLDIFGLGFGLLSAGVWNKILKDASIFLKPNDPNNHGWFKDASNAAVSNSLTLSKDKLSSTQTSLEAQNDLSSYVSQLIESWRGVLSTYNTDLFSGSGTTLSQLHDQITFGKGLNPAWGSTGLYDMEAIIKQVLFGLLIPKAWQTSNTDVHPVILLPKNGATGCTGNPNSDFISNQISAQSGVCYQNKAYYLFNVAGGPCNNIRGRKERRESAPPPPCPYSILSKLPGVETLDGTAWGGVTRDDLVISAIQAYRLNGNKNGYQMPVPSNVLDDQGSQGDLYFETGIQTPGITTIPVCDFDTVANNWDKYGNAKSKPDEYPCN